MGRSAGAYAGTDKLDNATNFVPPTTALSICCWARTAETTNGNFPAILSQQVLLLRFDVTNKRLRFDRNWTTQGRWGTPTQADLTTWRHYAVTYDGSVAGNVPTFYINGVLVATTTIQASVGTRTDTSSHLTAMNVTAGGNELNGDLADLSYHNVILTANEVLQHMNVGFVPRGLVGRWPLNSGAASGEYDMSGNQRTLALTGTVGVSAFNSPRAPVRLMAPGASFGSAASVYPITVPTDDVTYGSQRADATVGPGNGSADSRAFGVTAGLAELPALATIASDEATFGAARLDLGLSGLATIPVDDVAYGSRQLDATLPGSPTTAADSRVTSLGLFGLSAPSVPAFGMTSKTIGPPDGPAAAQLIGAAPTRVERVVTVIMDA